MAHANIQIADGHTGSVFGLWPPDAPSDTEGGRHVLNPLQAYIWECQQHAVGIWLPQVCGTTSRNALFYGDMVDGLQPKSPILTDDGGLQVRAAVMAWSPLVKTVETSWAVTGTEFHAGKSGTWDNAVALGLGCQQDETERAAHSQAFVQVDGVLFDMAHTIGGSYVPISRFTPLQREYVDSAVSFFEGEWPHVAWIIRGHSHYYRHIEDDGGHVVSLPGWQAKTGFAYRSSRRKPFDIGLAVVFTDDGRSWLEVKKYAWPTPKVYTVGWTPESQHQGSAPQSTSNGSAFGRALKRIQNALG